MPQRPISGRHQRDRGHRRRGAAIIAFVAVLLVLGTMSLWVLQHTASGSIASMGHFFGTGAFYSAESGLEMAMRELNASPPNDIDSDGTIGTISDNGNDADDPALASGAVVVTQSGTTPPTYEAQGRSVQSGEPWGRIRRVIEFQTE